MLFSHICLGNYYSYGDSGFLTFESSTSLHSTMNTPVNVKTWSNSNNNSVVWMTAAIPIKTVYNIGQQNMLHQSFLIANNLTSHWQHCQWLSQAVEGMLLGGSSWLLNLGSRRISMFLSNFHSSWTKPALYHLWGFVLHSEFGQLVLMCCGFWGDLQH